MDERVAATARDATAAVADASALLAAPFGALPTRETVWTSTVMQYLPPDGGPLRLAYLAELDDLDARGTLVAGRWPTAPGEVALPTTAARALGLDVGSSTALAASPGGAGDALAVVGTFSPRPAPAWDEDPLGGTGVGANYRGYISAYGPLVVAPGGLAAGAVPLRRVTLRVQPDLTRASAADLTRAGAGVDALGRDLSGALGDRAQNVVVDLPFARTSHAALEQRGVTSSGVLAVALLGGALAATTVVLAARLVASRRAAEAALLVARGTGRGRLVAQAAVEAGALALLAVVPATAAALALYRALAGGVGLDPARLPERGLASLVAGVAAVTLTLGALLVLPWLRTGTLRGTREDRVGVVARSGADLLLLALAAVAYLQLRAHRIASGATSDPVLVVAPVLCLLAGAALVLRPLPLLARGADARAASARSLALPLAAWGVARRPQGAAAAFLLVLATGCATFGVGFAATWGQSQRDQAAATVGTDLSAPAQLDALGTGATLRDVTGGRVSPATSRSVTLGSRAQGGDQAVQLVAVDTRDADGLLRGRLPAGNWADVTPGLAPAQGASGAAGGGHERRPGGHRSGRRRRHYHGHAHPRRPGPRRLACGAAGGSRRSGRCSARARGRRPAGVHSWPSTPGSRRSATRATPTGSAAPASPSTWCCATRPFRRAARGPSVTAPTRSSSSRRSPASRPSRCPRVFGSRSTAPPPCPGCSGRRERSARSRSDPVDEVPVVVSARLAAELGLGVGDGVQLALGPTPVQARVAAIAAYVPSQPRASALLADVDTLSRAALSAGGLDSVTDAWWVGGDVPAGAVRTLEGEGMGPVTDRAAVARASENGPLRAAQRAAAALLVVAAVVLTFVGTALHTTTALEARELDVARLRGLGAPRRAVLRSVLAEHTFLVVVPVLAGALLGAVACATIGPLLAVSAEGLPPVPAALVRWPWPALVATVLGIVLGCAALVVPLAARAVRRSTIGRLRMEPPA